MKKIFLITACVFTVVIIGLLIATNFIFITEQVSAKNPETINIYKKSIASLHNKSYDEDDNEYSQIVDHVGKVGKVSIFDRLISGSSLDGHIIESEKGEYSDNIADIKKTNVCVEFIYETRQDKIIYNDGNSKVISFNRLLYVLPTDAGVNKVIIYYANDQGYEDYNPLIMTGKTQNIINFIENL